ncbi:ExbD/TolR family protein [Nitratidesulfovibrio vulgaris]|uniref:ExbD/TolR family protein n=1 Tax=Nitratidesulfovibrio vulgaris TaxID=881 RepID=UPI0013E0B398|nr:biopolymer transporter ExbD [Nitratidesulfovibrio vulgaris]
MRHATRRAFSRRMAEEPDITPLLDVVFILLLFFVLAATFTVRGMDLDLPPAQSGKAVSGKVKELRLDNQGTLTCDGVVLGEEGLVALVRSNADHGRGTGARLVLKASGEAPVAALLRVVDTVRANGGQQLVIATSPAVAGGSDSPDTP